MEREDNLLTRYKKASHYSNRPKLCDIMKRLSSRIGAHAFGEVFSDTDFEIRQGFIRDEFELEAYVCRKARVSLAHSNRN